MHIDQTAPAQYVQSMVINAPVEVVWGLLAGIDRWPAWNQDIKAAHLQGELQPGTVFTWKTGSGKITSVLVEVEPGHLIGWTGKILGIKAVHIWRLEARDNTTIATSEESWRGWLPQLLPKYCRNILADSTTKALDRLKAAAELRYRQE